MSFYNCEHVFGACDAFAYPASVRGTDSGAYASVV